MSESEYTVRLRLMDSLSPNEMAISSYVTATNPKDAVLAGMRDQLQHGGRIHAQVFAGHSGYCPSNTLRYECVCTWDMHTDSLTIEEGGAPC